MWPALVTWLTTSAHWQGANGVPVRILEHLQYTGLSMLFALAIGLPVGALVGHTGRGGVLVVGVANGLRALPSLGLLTIVVLGLGLGLAPPIAALTVLAVPPLLAGTYAGIRAVDPAVVDAARGMGMREWEILLKVEVPNAMPLIFGGIRSATLQVVATATIAADVALGGLGRYVIDGLAQLDYAQMLAGALLVAVLAIVVDLVLVGVQRLVVSPGLAESGVSRRRATSRRTRNAAVSVTRGN
ncbi:MAG TPA: ABC transporter permease [Pseudonocardiaceae bacterium]|nr:ABC transporter permease [Pseudonocardiaceae bacterium]